MRKQAAWLAAPVVALGVAFGSRLDGAPVLCPFRLCTGHACPGCGITRATGALLRGDFAESVRYHPLAIIVAVQVAIIFVVALRRRESFGIVATAYPMFIWANSALFLGTWLLRWRFGLLDVVLA